MQVRQVEDDRLPSANVAVRQWLMAKIGEHAVVLGASMGGLLAARVLADFYETVTVVERDCYPTVRSIGGGFHRAAMSMPCWGEGPRSWLSCFPGSLTNSSRPEPPSSTTPICPRCRVLLPAIECCVAEGSRHAARLYPEQTIVGVSCSATGARNGEYHAAGGL